MKIHKLSLIAALAVAALAFSPALYAQEKDTKRERPPGAPGQRSDAVKERFARMAEELKLTDAQKPKVETALKEQVEKLRGLRDATPEERREKVQAVRADMDKKMKEILTAEQYAQWQKSREQGRGPREGRPDGPKKKREKKAEAN
jgi:Spy/CpxP family protein refolding chaperone